MSQKGWWGDKVIFLLSSDDERRHKTWCEYYDKDAKVCTKTEARCCGSAFCAEYEKREGVGIINVREYEYVPKETPKVCYNLMSDDISKEAISEKLIGKPIRPDIPKYISDIAACHLLSYNEKVGKVIIVNNEKNVVLGVIKSFDRECFTVKCENEDKVRTFKTKEAFRSKRHYVVDDIAEASI